MDVLIDTDQDTSEWEWSAVVRRYPSGVVVARFNVAPHPTLAKHLLLTLGEADSAKLKAGMGFDLRLNSPIDWTYLRVLSLNVVPSYSYEPIGV